MFNFIYLLSRLFFGFQSESGIKPFTGNFVFHASEICHLVLLARFLRNVAELWLEKQGCLPFLSTRLTSREEVRVLNIICQFSNFYL